MLAAQRRDDLAGQVPLTSECKRLIGLYPLTQRETVVVTVLVAHFQHPRMFKKVPDTAEVITRRQGWRAPEHRPFQRIVVRVRDKWPALAFHLFLEDPQNETYSSMESRLARLVTKRSEPR